jgi:hypothetical protein
MAKQVLAALLFFAALASRSQQLVSQPDLKAQYELPGDWKVQQYYKGGWDKPGGSSICHCALAVNILKVPSGDDFEYLHMVVYPSDKKGAADPQRGNVWQYHIQHGEQGDSVITDKLRWKHYTGRLTYSGENRFKDCVAWKYETHKDKTYYTVYFWARPGLLSQYQGVIHKIMNSFKPL